MRSHGYTVWFTGLSGSGKSTTALAVAERLRAEGVSVLFLDGDALREGLSSDLDFTAEGRDEAVRRAGEVALLLTQQGSVVLAALVSPRAVARDAVRRRHADRGVDFFEIHLSTPLEVCEHRDPKKLYRNARAGTTSRFTGVSDPYEAPIDPALRVSNEASTPDEVADAIRAILPR